MKRMTGLFASIAAGAILFAGAALAGEVTVKHAQGETKLPDVPQKVITFDLSSLDTLDTLGVKVAGVPTIKMQDYLSKYAADDYIKVGTLFEPDYEAVNAAQPDLIIVGGRSAAKYAELAKIAPTIDLTADAANFVKSSEDNIRTLANIFGKDKEAEDALTKLNAKKDELKTLTAKSGTGLLILTTGGKMSAYGPGSRFGVLYGEFGVKPAADDIKPGGHGQPISFEYILEKNPDWLYVIDRDAAIGREGVAAEKFLDNAVIAQTNAWKNKQVIYLDGSAWYLNASGLTSMEKIVDQLIAGLKK
ncbi:siderophore ABC transporter substrate-binding protein [Ochrobactrum sp. MR28]|jgi:iron complex transport system substrate-binding protein|uniref:Iron complex transport system substrate-binding protein n=2 Tax=Pseudochrobactrum asaccharolyticum TaxID=354351 RepID=A0A366E0P6_9HYPH|nr:siderophore ABC transporter substrate-binding protein [Ochrobactrum sp. MR28]MBX8815693.1 siderophore ABC transporter substrate-binding protein [Ochrobactrum sp. MR31]RBO95877.1 iron complex transport system substrate-binding protein [Pseudochrobactrum asaccharolyticum]